MSALRSLIKRDFGDDSRSQPSHSRHFFSIHAMRAPFLSGRLYRPSNQHAPQPGWHRLRFRPALKAIDRNGAVWPRFSARCYHMEVLAKEIERELEKRTKRAWALRDLRGSITAHLAAECGKSQREN